MLPLLNIDVPDLEAAIAFYHHGLGLPLVRRLFDGEVAELRLGGCAVFLLEKAAGSPCFAGGQQTRDYSPHWAPVHLDIQVEDLDATLAAALAAGATREAPVRSAPYGRIAVCRDPFGHGICFIEMNADGYDAVS